MKHFVMILIGAVLLYGGWQLTSPLDQKECKQNVCPPCTATHCVRHVTTHLIDHRVLHTCFTFTLI